VHAFTASLSTVFLVAAAVSVLGFLLTWLVPEQPLRETIAAAAGTMAHDAGEAFPMPTSQDSGKELLRGLAVLANRDVQRAYIEQIVARAGVQLSPAEALLLVRFDEDAHTDVAAIARIHRLDPGRMETAARALLDHGLVTLRSGDGKGAEHRLTHAGCEVLGRVVAARRERLAELMHEWPPEKREELSIALRRLARELVPEPNRPAA
jgi:DNA-binding MarR family transcriptional regulator